MKLINFIFIFTVFYTIDAQRNKNPKEVELFKKIIQDYDPNFRPNEGNATVIKVEIIPRHISRLSSHKQEMTVEFTVYQQWKDYRLNYEEESIIPYILISDPNLIWTPNLNFFSVLKEDLSNQHIQMKIFRNGDVQLSKFVIQTFRCTMNFKYFPFDRNDCQIGLYSFKYNTDELLIQWDSNLKFNHNLDLQIEDLNLYNYTQMNGILKDQYKIPFSYIGLNFHFQRLSGTYLLKIFMPCSLLVILSFTNLWISSNHHNIKLFTCLSTFLSLLLISVYNDWQLPKTNYTKSIDIYVGFCITLTLTSYVISILTYYGSNDTVKLIEIKSKFVLPIIFALFNIVYICAYY